MLLELEIVSLTVNYEIVQNRIRRFNAEEVITRKCRFTSIIVKQRISNLK